MSRKSHFHRSARRSDDQHIARRRRGLRVERLEDRRLLAIFVDNLIDEADGSITDGDISLRDAIALAPAGETIGFVYGGTIDLTLGELMIDKDLTISAGSGLQLTIDAQENSRIFNITGGNVGISSLTLTRGRADDPFDRAGGAIRNQGSLTITSSTITTSYAYFGGGIANVRGGTLTITGSTISENSAGISGGGVLFDGVTSTEDSMSIIDSTISGNTAKSEGGGIYAYAFPYYGDSYAPIMILNSTISGNAATGYETAAGVGIKGFGGGVFLYRAITPVISGSLISNNSARAGGGIFQTAYSELTIADSTISDNTASSEFPEFLAQGGGVLIASSNRVSITASMISGNVADVGGGIRNFGRLAVSGSNISDNTAEYSGGGISSADAYSFSSTELTIVTSTISGNNVTDAQGVGGGIANQGGELRIERSTLSGNSAGGAGAGGGLYNGQGTANIINSTVSENEAGIGRGGGVWNADVLDVFHSTITKNGSFLGGGVYNIAGTATFGHSIISANGATGGSAREILNEATVVVNDYNLFGSSGRTTAQALVGVIPGATDITATSNGTLPTAITDILDTTLSDNGGPTLTHSLAAGSPAINAGDPAFSTPPDSDQRGLPFVRQSGSRIDIGAIEDQPELLIVTTLNDESNGTGAFSLREAIEIANITMGPDLISFDSDLAGGTIDLTLGELDIADDVTIVGLGADQLTVDGGGNSRIFDIGLNTRANISGLTITGGSADNGAGIRTAGNTNVTLAAMVVTGNVATQDGGGVHAFSNLTIVDSTISGNTAGDDGGGLWIYNDDENFGERAIISNSTISGNTAAGSGGGVYIDLGETSIRHSTITQNTAAVGDGVLSRASSLVSTRFRSTIIADNTDNDDVASVGFEFNSILSDGYNVVGGGNANGSFIATGDQSGVFDPQLLPLSDNGGPTPTHALLLSSPALDAGDPTDVAGQGIVRSFDQRRSGFDRIKGAAIDVGAFEQTAVDALVVDTLEDTIDGDYSPGDVSLRELLAFANASPGNDAISFASTLEGETIQLTQGQLLITDDVTIEGLGADRLTIDANGGSRVFNILVNQTVSIGGLTLTGGNADQGGAIRSGGNSDVSLNRVVISGNAAAGNGGGIQSYGSLWVSDSTISGNTAGDDGGGVWIYNDFFTPAGSNIARILNSTISGNTAGGEGGGIYATYGRTLIRHSTITENTAANGGGVSSFNDYFAYNRTEVYSSIIAGNTNNDDVTTVGFGNSSIRSDGFNLVGAGNAAAVFTGVGDQTNVTDPLLGALADNGGPTPTHLPQMGSLAVDRGDPDAVAGASGVPQFDQRGEGFERVSGSRIDIGAVEVPSAAVDGDFNDDGVYDCLDIDALTAAVAAMMDDPAFDLTADGVVNLHDVSAWLVVGGANNQAATGGNPFLPGDANLSGVVDVSDFNIWNNNKFTANTAWCSGDFNADGVVDVSDFNIWNINKFTSSNPAARFAIGMPQTKLLDDLAAREREGGTVEPATTSVIESDAEAELFSYERPTVIDLTARPALILDEVVDGEAVATEHLVAVDRLFHLILSISEWK